MEIQEVIPLQAIKEPATCARLSASTCPDIANIRDDSQFQVTFTSPEDILIPEATLNGSGTLHTPSTRKLPQKLDSEFRTEPIARIAYDLRKAMRKEVAEVVERAFVLLSGFAPNGSGDEFKVKPSQIYQALTGYPYPEESSAPVASSTIRKDLVALVESATEEHPLTCKSIRSHLTTKRKFAAELGASPEDLAILSKLGVPTVYYRTGGEAVEMLPREVALRAIDGQASRIIERITNERFDVDDRAEFMTEARALAGEFVRSCTPTELAEAFADQYDQNPISLRNYIVNGSGRNPFWAPEFKIELTEPETGVWERILDIIPMETALAEVQFSDQELEVARRKLTLKRFGCETLTWVHHEAFEAPQAQRLIDALPAPTIDDLKDPSGKSQKLRSFTGHEEKGLFFRMNYEKYQAWKALKEVDPSNPSEASFEKVMEHLRSMQHYRSTIAQANLGLVYAMAYRCGISQNQGEAGLYSAGNIGMLNAIDRFDASAGFKFSTYACHSIKKGFFGDFKKQSDAPEGVTLVTDIDWNAIPEKFAAEELSPEFKRAFLERLELGFESCTEREAMIISARFGFEDGEIVAPKTLEEVGVSIGLTKERVRQLQNRALVKLRPYFEDVY